MAWEIPDFSSSSALWEIKDWKLQQWQRLPYIHPVDHSSGNSLLLTSLLPVGETAAPVVGQFCCVILGAGLEAQQSHSSRLANDFISV